MGELNRLGDENRALNEELNFISSTNAVYELEGRIHELQLAVGEREHEIGRLL